MVLSYPPIPPLRIGRAGQDVVLSWPLCFSNVTALAATNLAPPVNWTALDMNAIVRGATNCWLTVPTAPGIGFYWLRSP